jgi:response regulator RpfG family c-di-GMP phosphodiesterase
MIEPRSSPGPRNVRSLLLAGLLATLLGGLVYLTGAFGALERDSLSLRFQLRGEQTARDVAVVGIDEESFRVLNQRWPFPRSLHAAMVNRLHSGGAREIVYDVQFTEQTSPEQDMALYRAIGRAGGAVLATTETDGPRHSYVLGGQQNLGRVHAVAGSARFNDDVGGVVTHVPYTSYGFKTLAVATAERDTGKHVSKSAFGSEGAWIDYRGGPGAIPTYSFASVLHGRVPASKLRGKIVVVGATAQSLQDLHATPTSGSELMAGPEVEANAIWTVLHGNPLRSAPVLVNLLLIVLLGFAAPLARLRLVVLVATAAAFAAAAAFALAAQLSFNAGWIVPVVPPLVALVSGVVAMVAVSEVRERFERLRVAAVNELLEERVRERTEELRETQLEVIRRLSQAAESRDEVTGHHIQRIGVMCERLALAAGLSPERAEMLRFASAMHDVGKIGIPDSVLLKPGRLDEKQWAKMRTHPQIGAEILDDSRSPVVQLGREIALTHHERWDGSGYPAGLVGSEIPIEGRICAICDVFDALLSERPYKRAWPLADVIKEVRAQRGRHFDPQLIDLFLPMAAQFHTELGYGAGLRRVRAPIVGVDARKSA